MDDPTLYSKNDFIQRQDTSFVLKEYGHLLNWTSMEDGFLDVGCGPGDITHDLLLPSFPENFRGEVVGVDLSKSMIDYANGKYGDEKLKFRQWDIASDTTPKEFQGVFNHVVSFYCIHWVLQQKKCFTNLYNSLKDGGDMLILFLANNPIFQIYRIMAATKKWHPYMEDVEKFVSYYQDSKNPSEELNNLLVDIGFHVKTCITENRTYTFPHFKTFVDSVRAVNPFQRRMSPEVGEEFIKDYIEEVRKFGFITPIDVNNNESEKSPTSVGNVNNDTERVSFPYHILIAYATKKAN